jgi:multidrug efflux system outer membrane protein
MERLNMGHFLGFLPLLPLLVSCAVTPDYERRELDVPEAFVASIDSGESMSNLNWWELFQDDQLELLIRTSLEENRDLAIALSRIEESRAKVISVRADQFPFLNLGAVFGRGQQSRDLIPFASPVNRFAVTANVSYQVDFWGQYSRATESAQATLLATEAAYKTVTISLVSSVASTYLLLRDLDKRLEVSEQTLCTRLDSMAIIQARFDKGTVPRLDVYQAQIEVSVAEVAIATFQRQIVQTENALRILLGRNPGPVVRGDTLEQQIFQPQVPAGLPSELLQRRPDVMQAEADLMAATAAVGVAEALRYPSISLTGNFGVESLDLSDLNSSNAQTWGVGANLLGPIFNSGQLKAQADGARQRAVQAGFLYERTLQQSFREVEDALVAVRTYLVEKDAQTRRADAALSAAKLSRARYSGGIVDYLEVLDAERTLFNAELAESETLQLYYNAIVGLYQALGGGWTVPEG